MTTPDNTVSKLNLPVSYFLGESSRAAYQRHDKTMAELATFLETLDSALSVDEQIYQIRDYADNFALPQLIAQQKHFAVNIEADNIGGIPVKIITPKAAVTEANAQRVLLNFHGGSFQFGRKYGGEIESIPIAAQGNIKVITVDYRMAPEHRFPAASEDAAAVYKELLKHYKPENIGIYGCSAGAMLTAQALAWYQQQGLPMPGAIGLFAAGADHIEGDSIYFQAALRGTEPFAQTSMLYYQHVAKDDPLAFPGTAPEVLRQFPPTLLISSSRDFLMSSVLVTHRKLTELGVNANLQMWEGMEHAFHFDPDFEESHQAYRAIVKHFDQHLGSQAL